MPDTAFEEEVIGAQCDAEKHEQELAQSASSPNLLGHLLGLCCHVPHPAFSLHLHSFCCILEGYVVYSSAAMTRNDSCKYMLHKSHHFQAPALG